MCIERSQKAWEKDLRYWKSNENRDHPDHGIVKISLNTEMVPGDKRKLAVTQAPVKDHEKSKNCREAKREIST